MNISIFFQQIANSIVIGSIYVLIAIGITVVFGVAQLVNFAHCHFMILAAFIALTLQSYVHNFVVLTVLVCMISGAIAVVVHLGLFERTRALPVNGFIISLALILFLQGLTSNVWGVDEQNLQVPVHGVVDIGGVLIEGERLVVVLVAAVLVAATFWWLEWTRSGWALRAASENPVGSALVGINVRRVIAIAFVGGSLLAALGGVFYGTLFSFDPYTANNLVIDGFAIAIIGGLGNVRGAVIASFLLAVVQTFGSAYWNPAWQEGYGFALIIIVLLVRPRGLLGTAGRTV
jgi:branched-chain amino acid transport system permease protein